ncbi:hypothetical protein CTAYLR_008613 [Chrysophaeum taylorii]|uniref:phosphoserine phosphatase n=1 Tax=Chrysophaeum taylorii TaxID=2483200 RepID=A0AAD7UI64_9STRA|nr:hypothetical protein CTAYLR_008613 [Chrysophaeum taylorii]
MGGRRHIGTNVALAQDALRRADAVCFDFDSTVITEEGIDELAEFCGAGEAVAAFTKQAMEGDLPFQRALAARLELIQPSRDAVTKCLEQRPPTLSPHVGHLFEALRARGATVHIVSGGFRAMIEPVALDALGVQATEIFANTIIWRGDGEYAGFDATEPTASEGGKPKVVEFLKKTRGYDTVVMIGDGATDLQAKPPADAFIGYGGVAQRDIVLENADWFITDFGDLVAFLENDQIPPGAAAE